MARSSHETRRFRAAGWHGKVVGDSVYTCEPSSPEVGCLRVSYKQSTATHASYIGQVFPDGRTRAWHAPHSWMCSGRGSSSAVDLFFPRALEAQEMIDLGQPSNSTTAWIFRISGVAAAVIGIICLLQPLQAAADLVSYLTSFLGPIPLIGPLVEFLGDAVSGMVGCAIMLVSCGIGVPSALAVLAFFAALMRPLLGVPLLIGCAAVLVFTFQKLMGYAKAGKAKRLKQS